MQFTISGPPGPAERHVPSEYSTIQAAINAASNGDVVIVAPGTYTGDGNRDIDFLGKAITVRSTDPNDPCIVVATIIDCNGSQYDPNRGFYFHNGESSNSILDGFTITKGYGPYGSDGQNISIPVGGGIYCYYSSPTIKNCIITGNNTTYDPNHGNGPGGGISCVYSNASIINCKIIGNTVGYGYGGGIYGYHSNISITNCVISGNSATQGCGIYFESGAPVIYGCSINNNSSIAGGRGSLYFKGGASPTITNCLITANTAYPGGICCWLGGGGATISNCTIVNNTPAPWGGAIYWASPATVTVTNCICRGNHGTYSPGGLREIYENITVSYTNIQDNSDPTDWKYVAGIENIDAEPCFVTGPMGDYYLSQTIAGQTTNSPCVDTGSDTAENLNMNSLTTRTDGVPDTGVVNMGYHYPTSIVVLSSDLDRNYFVDFFDYALMSLNWQQSPDPCDSHSGDIIKNGIVDIQDLAELCADWLTCYVTQAAAPQPADQAFGVSTHAVLQWSPGENSISHDVYFSTNFNAVDTADTASSGVYMGNQDVNYWDCNNYINELDANTTYYWRIDEMGPACSTKGTVWNLTTIETNGPAAWWKFDEANGTTAYDSAGNNDGQLINGPVWTSGYIDGGLSFDGVNDYVDVPDNAALRFPQNGDFSICSWVKPMTSSSNILCKMQSGSQHGLFTYELQWNSICQCFDFQLCNSGNYSMYVITSSGSAPPGSWYHVACVYQNKNVMIYLNGELKGSGYFNSNATGVADKNLAIGVRAYSSIKENYFNGIIDDVRIYNRALTAGEVALLWQQGQ